MNKNSKIQYLVGNKIVSNSFTEPYNDKVINFLSDLAVSLNSNSNTKNYPDIKALAFFCRKKNLLNLKKKFASEDLRFGLGLIYHITPSNIPTNFAYSLIFGLLTGNSNVVKIPTKSFIQINLICSSLKKIIKKKNYSFLRKMISIIRYKQNDDITKKLSMLCDARIIWGGDKSISEIRKFPLKAKSIDLPFADRYSATILNSLEILKLKEFELNRLVENFYNDTYSVDQNACSSPHIILWIGKKSKRAQEKFWNKLNIVIKKKYSSPSIASVDSYLKLCENFLNLNEIKNYKIYNRSMYVVKLKSISQAITAHKGKWGFFYEYDATNIEETKKVVNRKLQTLTYYGFTKSFLKKFISSNKPSGIDRIVPIGQALDISLIWDGYDINKILSRTVEIR